jgi:hypothetical protein
MNNERDNEGLLTQIWGPSFWHILHCISFNYPKNPTHDDISHYKNFFKSLCFVLPCCDCRSHFTEHIKEGETKLTDDIFKNRDTLTKWLYNFHICVNKRLGVYYDISYETLCKKYNSYIASCELTSEEKSIAFKNYYNIEAPILKYDLLKYFDNYAKKRGIRNFLKIINKINDIDHESDMWIARNNRCWNLIKEMRLHSISSVELSGEFKGYPTIAQLNLMKYMCTTIPEKIILHLIKKM